MAALPPVRAPVPEREPVVDRELAAERELVPLRALVAERELAEEREPVPARELVVEREPVPAREPVAERELVPLRALEVALLADRVFGAPAFAPRGPAARPLPEAMSSSISPLLLGCSERAKARAAHHGTGLCNDYPGDVLLSQG
ncbi:MAG TPA: hypothetical protein VMS00_07495, partial [Acidimicrobiales bacterium]|nr:hypothetical protein [Acidimicrobiales bacterium]